ncbi:MAG TPA: polyprenol phosphomannose-dependent alpha 1,6 mannosyltransferase MptB, partial [Ktedonobacteraceae bacterium]
MKRVAEKAPLSLPANSKAQSAQTVPARPILFYAIAYVACTLIAVTPLYRAAGVPYIQLFTTRILLFFGQWLPTDFYHAQDATVSQSGTAITLFIALMWLAFILYGLSAYAILRKPSQANYRNIQRIIWIMTIVVGCIFIVTPVMLSHDIFVYISYGRIITYYHTNPYFTPFAYFPKDPFFSYDDWKNVLSAYGPVWETVSALASLVIRDHLGRALLVFRSISFAAHLLNIALIALILRAMGRSPRTITLGTLLYAWNPLALEESSLGGHNDVFMVTLILAGIFFYVRAEQQTQEPAWRRFLPSTLAFSLAVLVKLTALPVLVLYMLLLAIRAFKETPSQSETQSIALQARLVNVFK